MAPGIFEGVGNLILVMLVALAIAIPFAVWKMIDLVLYVLNHLQWAS